METSKKKQTEETDYRLIGKLYYSIGEVAEIFKMNTSKIRFWEKEFDVLQPKKNAKGERRYTEQDIDKIKLIHHLVEEKGYTLEGARQKIKINPQGENKNIEIIEKLKKIKTYLIDLKKEIEG
jgi:DNA-binding transcriptional MerR regulator